MSQEVIMPKLGLTMTQGKITKWLKNVGEQVKAGEAIAEIETDKISSEVESPVDGFVLKILAEEGEEKAITVPICIVGEESELAGVQSETPSNKSETVRTERVFITPIAKRIAKENEYDYSIIQGTGPLGRIVKADILKALQNTNTSRKAETPERIRISPVAKEIAIENGIEYSCVKGTGPDGRIVKSDILAAIEQKKNIASVQVSAQVLQGQKQETNTQEQPVYLGEQEKTSITKKVPLAGIRKVIARRLAQSKHDIPHVYFKSVIDATGLFELKNRLSEAVKAKAGKKLSVNEVIIKAVAVSLAEFPDVNVSLVNDEIIYYRDVNVGMAVSIDKGLVVPVIRNTDKKGLSELCQTAGELAERARNGKLMPDDMTGGTFTVSNLGAYGIDEFSAIINPPESAILAVGAAKEIPCAENGQISVKKVLTLNLSVDHRVIDGALAAQFMKRLKELLENPYTMLI